MIDISKIGQNLKEKIAKVPDRDSERMTGRIVYTGDGIVRITGLSDVKYNELLDVKGGYRALAHNLEEGSVVAVLFLERIRQSVQ